MSENLDPLLTRVMNETFCHATNKTYKSILKIRVYYYNQNKN